MIFPADRRSLFGFFDRELAQTRQTLRQEPGERGRHVLHDKNRDREVVGKLGRICANAFGPPVEQPMATTATGSGILLGEAGFGGRRDAQVPALKLRTACGIAP